MNQPKDDAIIGSALGDTGPDPTTGEVSDLPGALAYGSTAAEAAAKAQALALRVVPKCYSGTIPCRL